MSTIEREREVVCERCSRPLGIYSSTIITQVGSCCEYIPPRWEFDDDEGTYTRRVGDELGDEGGDDDDETPYDDRPECDSCGSVVFTCVEIERYSRTVDRSDSFDERTLYVSQDQEYEEQLSSVVRCANCDALWYGPIEYDT
jgi:hypothetical protein